MHWTQTEIAQTCDCQEGESEPELLKGMIFQNVKEICTIYFVVVVITDKTRKNGGMHDVSYLYTGNKKKRQYRWQK